MARVCDFCGKGTAFGGSIARRGLPKKKGGVGLRITGRTKRTFKLPWGWLDTLGVENLVR